MVRMSDENKMKLKLGQGVMQDYRSWIRVGEFGSIGTASVAVDWKTGRPVHLFSYGERLVWQMLRFNDNIIDIREQYPLDIEITTKIAKELEIDHPKDQKTGIPYIMTTDLLATFNDGRNVAYTIKESMTRATKKQRTMDKILIEQCYWEDYMNTKFAKISKDKINITYSENIRCVCQFYDRRYVIENDITILKHLIARKIVRPNLAVELDFQELMNTYRKEIEEWKKQNYIQLTSSDLMVTDTEY